jgi:hypothetical protein
MPISKIISPEHTNEKSDYDPDNLDEALKKLPALISWQTEIVDQALSAVKEAKFDLENKESRLTLKFIDKGYRWLEARSLVNANTVEERKKILDKDIDWRKARSELKKLQLELNSVKKRASLRIEEIKQGI